MYAKRLSNGRELVYHISICGLVVRAIHDEMYNTLRNDEAGYRPKGFIRCVPSHPRTTSIPHGEIYAHPGVGPLLESRGSCHHVFRTGRENRIAPPDPAPSRQRDGTGSWNERAAGAVGASSQLMLSRGRRIKRPRLPEVLSSTFALTVGSLVLDSRGRWLKCIF